MKTLKTEYMNYDKSLQDILFDLLTDDRYTFHALFLAELNKSFEDKLPTACVGKHVDSSNIELIIGKKWWSEVCFNDSRKKWTIIHELEHVIREHLSDVSQSIYPDKLIANIAMDMSINQDIHEEAPSTFPDGTPTKIVDIADFKELKLLPNQSSYYYYTELQKAKKAKKESAANGEDSKSGQKGKGTSGCKALDEFIDGNEDWHKSWNELIDNMSDKEKEIFRKEIQDKLARIAEETEKNKGTIPAHLQNAIKSKFGRGEAIISWKTLFNRFIGSTLSTDIYQTRKRPNFRFEDAPSNKYKSKIKIIVGYDSSGSVSDNEIKEFFGQIRHMWKAGVKVDICVWDAQCEDPYEYKGENTYKRTKCGGRM